MDVRALALCLLLLGCSSEDHGVSGRSPPSGCVEGSIEQYCEADPEGCELTTLHQSPNLSHFFACEGWDAGTCCEAEAAACKADRVVQQSCSCRDRASGETFTRVQFSSGFDGRAFYFDRSGLVATAEWVDTNAYCRHTSPERWYGTVLECPCSVESSGAG